MGHVVIGDLAAIVQAVGVAGVGGVQWSMPKLYDDLAWRDVNFPILVARCARVFCQLAEVENLEHIGIELNPYMKLHEDRFQATKSTLRGYVRGRILYHGTDLIGARQIL